MKFSWLEQLVCIAMYALPSSGYCWCWYSAGVSGLYAKVWRTNATYTTGEQVHLPAVHSLTAVIILQPRHPDASLPALQHPDQLNEKECFQEML